MRKQIIPTAILSTTITACTDPIIGDWDGITVSTNDQAYSMGLPYEYCYTVYDYNAETGEETGEEYCNTMDFDLSIDSDLTGSMNLLMGGSPLSLSLEIEKSDRETYKITATIDENESLQLDCTLTSASNMNCNFEELDFSVDFEKQ